MIYVHLQHQSKVKVGLEFRGRTYRECDKDMFHTHLKNVNWDAYWLMDDPNQAWEYFLNEIIKFLNITCPIKDIYIKEEKQEWMSDELLRPLDDKDALLKVARLSGNEDDWNIADFFMKKAKRDLGKLNMKILRIN